MAKFQDYFKVVTPKIGVTTMTDNQTVGDQGTYANYTWYQRLIQGSASRITRYREYDLMDNDVEIARSLDTIAEEMIGSDPNSDTPLKLVIHSEKEDVVPTSTVTTLRSALAYWCDLHDWNIRLFKISRVAIKYGDCFFIRKKETMKWEYIHPKHIIAAIVDERDMTKVMGWQIKRDVKTPNSPYNQPVGNFGSYSNEMVDTFSADDVIWFTLNDDVSDTAPFGDSILRAVYRSQKQKELLEDAILIYRIQRAPERKAFYVDVGKMPPNRVKGYLESIKNDIRQRKVPTMGGGTEQLDSVYNPMSMCLALDTQIPLLDGREVTLQCLINEHNEGTQNWVYSINPLDGNIVPGIISWAGITQTNAETIRLTLDNGETIVCTPEHKFPIQGKGFIEAKDITPDDSLFPFNSRQEQLKTPSGKTKGKYQSVYNPKTKGWNLTHRMVANFMLGLGKENEMVFNEKYKHEDKNTIHHCDFNSLNNSPDNLFFMNRTDHCEYHRNLSNNQEAIFSPELINRFEELANEDIDILFNDLMYKINNDDQFMTIYQADNQKQELTKFKLKTEQFRQKMFLVFIKKMGYQNWKDYQNVQIVNEIKKITNMDEFLGSEYSQDHTNLIQFVLDLVKSEGIHNFALINYLKNNTDELDMFILLYKKVFKRSTLSIPEASMFERIAKLYNYSSFKHLIKEARNFNHKVVKIENWTNQDVGTLTIDGDHKYHNYHTFALTHCFTKNSEDYFFASRPDGRGSRVEALAGGAGLGNLEDLEYFQGKVFRGLRIPLSFMQDGSNNSILNDGKTGIAYIQELRFAMYIKRLQNYIGKVLDAEFKRYLRMCSIQIDPTIFSIKLPEPENFGIYRQQQLNGDLLSTYSQADGVAHFAKRFTMSKYLQLSQEDILLNQRMKAEELGLDPDSLTKQDLQQIYNPAPEGGMGDMGGLGGGMAAGTLGGMGDMGMGDMGAEGGMGDMGAEGGAGAGAGAGAGVAPPM